MSPAALLPVIGIYKLITIVFGPSHPVLLKYYHNGELLKSPVKGENKMTTYEIGLMEIARSMNKGDMKQGYVALSNCKLRGSSNKDCVKMLAKMGYNRSQIKKMFLTLKKNRPSVYEGRSRDSRRRSANRKGAINAPATEKNGKGVDGADLEAMDYEEQGNY
jgi:hypothetical protein